MGSVSTLQALTAESAARIIRQIAAISGRVEFIEEVLEEMQRLWIDRSHAVTCCLNAAVTQKPVIDNHGNIAVSFYSYSSTSGENIRFKAVIEGDQAAGQTLIVVEVGREFWPAQI